MVRPDRDALGLAAAEEIRRNGVVALAEMGQFAGVMR